MNPLDNTEKVSVVMRELAESLMRHLGVLPDAVLILRDGEMARTLFAANPDNDFADCDPREVLTEVLENAVIQNRGINTQIARSKAH